MSELRNLVAGIATEGHGSNKLPTTLEAFTYHGRNFTRPNEPTSRGLRYPYSGGNFNFSIRQFPYKTFWDPIWHLHDFDGALAGMDTSVRAGGCQ